jgi:dihydrofolate reductase
MKLSIIVAASENNVIGVGNELPWRLPDDLRRFKALTMGKPVVMGRKTFASIGKPLPGRLNIVISHQQGMVIEGVVVVGSIEAALGAARPAEEVMVIGGAQIYRQALPRTTMIYMTRVHTQTAGDAYFPALAREDWREIDSELHPADDRHACAFTFLRLERISPCSPATTA